MTDKNYITKKKIKNKAFTLVEVMAAMAIISIIFVGISGFIINTVKIDARAKRKLESEGYLKNALFIFESGLVRPSDNLSFTIKFDDINEMQQDIVKLSSDNEENKIYRMEIESELYENNLYKVTATFINLKDEKYSKNIYVLKE